MKTFIIATKNPHKLAELSRILIPLGISAVSEGDIGVTLPEVEETGKTFAENALLKAKSACEVTGLPAVADDSGLCVDALDGAPGLYSARYAGEGASSESRIEKLLRNLEGVPENERGAFFVSSICCYLPDGQTLSVEGRCCGKIIFEPRGNGGFGYDPVFEVDGKTFAEMIDSEKDAHSHRGKSLKKLSEELPAFLTKHSFFETD